VWNSNEYKKVHPDWNNIWNDFKAFNPEPESEDLLDKLKEMIIQFDLIPNGSKIDDVNKIVDFEELKVFIKKWNFQQIERTKM